MAGVDADKIRAATQQRMAAQNGGTACPHCGQVSDSSGWGINQQGAEDFSKGASESGDPLIEGAKKLLGIGQS